MVIEPKEGVMGTSTPICSEPRSLDNLETHYLHLVSEKQGGGEVFWV